MGQISIPIDLHLNVPFSQLQADPLLILRKFPQVESIENKGAGIFRMVTKPLPVTDSVTVRRRWYVNISASPDRLTWDPVPDNQIDPNDRIDGWITGYAVSDGQGGLLLHFDMVQQHQLLNALTKALYGDTIKKLVLRIIKEFEQNFADPNYWNTVPA